MTTTYTLGFGKHFFHFTHDQARGDVLVHSRLGGKRRISTTEAKFLWHNLTVNHGFKRTA